MEDFLDYDEQLANCLKSRGHPTLHLLRRSIKLMCYFQKTNCAILLENPFWLFSWLVTHDHRPYLGAAAKLLAFLCISMSYSTNRRNVRLSSAGRKQKQQKDSSVSLPEFLKSKNSRRELTSIMWARMRTRLVRENLFLENPSFWNGYTEACTDPNRSWLPSFPSARKQIKYWRAPKKFGAKKASKICMETAKKRKSTAAGTQLLTGKQSTAGKPRWSEGTEKAKWWWNIQRSAQMDGENKPVTIEYLPLSQRDSHLTHFRTPKLFHRAGAAQWSGLRATDFPPSAPFWLRLIAHIAVLWLCRWDWRTGRPWFKSTVHLTSWVTEHSRELIWAATTVFSPFFPSALP